MKQLRFIFLASFFFSLHMALLAYVNSSMLGEVASTKEVGSIYILASLLSLSLVTFAPKLVRILGNWKYTILALTLSSALLYFISTSSGQRVIPLFMLYFALNAIVLYGLDIFLEHYTSEAKTGNIRGLYLTLGNIGWVVAPSLSGFLEGMFGFKIIYLFASIAVLITLGVLYFSQKGFVDRHYNQNHFIDGLRALLRRKDLRMIAFLNFLLQFFFVIMVIYSPVYLTTVIGFSWKALGLLLSIMLLPFVLFPYPAGYIADKYLGEKELLFTSLIIMGLATLFFAKLGSAPFALYGLALFLTRMGASIFESMCESTFFKRVTDKDASVISTYRNMMPIAYIIGPLLGGAFLATTSYETLFFTLGIVMLSASLYTLRLKDTK